MDPSLFQGLKSLGPAWQDWTTSWTQFSPGPADLSMIDHETHSAENLNAAGAAMSAIYRTRLTWLRAHPSPDAALNRRLEDYLGIAERTESVMRQMLEEEADERDEGGVLVRLLDDARECVTQLQARVVQLLRGS